MLNWLFIDMNSFFASAEQHLRVELRGRPVGVAPTETEATCCIAASVEAKRHGVRTGTPIYEARRMCPGIAIVTARPAVYTRLHRDILRAVDRCAPVDTVYSIDEWAIRLLGCQRDADVASALAVDTKRAIRDHVGPCLPASAGIASTRLLAKIACEMHKPDGLTVLHDADLPQRIRELALTDLPGIGAGMARRLVARDIVTVPQLWSLSKSRMREIWGGVPGERYWAALHGIDEPDAPTRRSTMGHAHVLAPDRRSDAGAHGVMTRLIHKLGGRLRQHGYYAHCLHASARYVGGHRWADRIELPGCRDTQTLLQHFQMLWVRRPLRFRDGHAGPIKKVGVTVTGLTTDASTPDFLFDGAHRSDRLADAIDRVNLRWGAHTVYFGGMHDTRQKMEDKIAFGRIPDEHLRM